MLQEVLQFMRQHGGAWPTRHSEADALRKKFDRVRARSTDAQRPLSARAMQLLGECEANMPEQRWSRNDRRRHHRVFVKRQAALRRSCAAWGAEHQRYGYSLPCLQLFASPGNVFGGSSPYPGLVNLGSTCYFNAVLQ